MKHWLVFIPLVSPNDTVVGLSVAGLVRAVDGEHAIRVAKTKGFPSPIVGEKGDTTDTAVGSKRFLSLGHAGNQPAAPRRTDDSLAPA